MEQRLETDEEWGFQQAVPPQLLSNHHPPTTFYLYRNQRIISGNVGRFPYIRIPTR